MTSQNSDPTQRKRCGRQLSKQVEIQRLDAEEKPSPTAIARRLGIARSSMYRFLTTTERSAAQELMRPGRQATKDFEA